VQFFMCVTWLSSIVFGANLVTYNKFENYVTLRLVEHIIVQFVLPSPIIFLVNFFLKG
jgi:hypothetical protein